MFAGPGANGWPDFQRQPGEGLTLSQRKRWVLAESAYWLASVMIHGHHQSQRHPRHYIGNAKEGRDLPIVRMGRRTFWRAINLLLGSRTQ